jgi:hypothetical protein
MKPCFSKKKFIIVVGGLGITVLNSPLVSRTCWSDRREMAVPNAACPSIVCVIPPSKLLPFGAGLLKGMFIDSPVLLLVMRSRWGSQLIHFPRVHLLLHSTSFEFSWLGSFLVQEFFCSFYKCLRASRTDGPSCSPPPPLHSRLRLPRPGREA